MSSLADAMNKLQSLSSERAQKVIGLIDDLAALEAMEMKADLEAAQASLAEPGEDIVWEDLKKELNAKLDCPAPASCKVPQ